MDSAAFCQLLDATLSPDNTVRKQASDNVMQQRQTDPAGLITRLVATIRQPNIEEKFRNQAAILLRNALRDFLTKKDDAVWKSLPLNVQQGLKTELIAAIEAEPVKLVRSHLCDTVSDLASVLIEANQWPEFLPKMFQLVMSPQPPQKASALKILAEIVPDVSSVLEENAEQVAGVVKSCIATPDLDVRYECLGLIAAVCCNTSAWKKLTDTIPQLMVTLTEMLQKKFAHAKEYLESLIEIADAEPGFFKNHVPAVTTQMFAIARERQLENGMRQLAFEFLLSYSDQRPKNAAKLPGFVNNMVFLCMELMLEVEENPAWLDGDEDEEEDDEEDNYTVGEEGLDRFASAMDAQTVLPVVFANVGNYLKHTTSWKHKLVATMAIAQVVEYIDEDDLESYLPEIMKKLLELVKDPHHRVRYAALHAIGQVALDQAGPVQEDYYAEVLPALLACLDDPVPKVVGHAASAFVNFGEEVEADNMLPYVDVLMQKLSKQLLHCEVRHVREMCVTAIAVVAGVVEENFVKYYPEVMPLMKKIVTQCTAKEENRMRGKAFECISLLGMAVGKDMFLQDGKEACQAMLTLLQHGVEADDTLKEFIHEALQRICRVLKDDFIPYVQFILPSLLEVLKHQPLEVEDPENNDDMSMMMLNDGKCVGLKTTLIEEMTAALTMAITFTEVLGKSFAPFVPPVATTVVPLLSFHLSDDVKRKAIQCVGQLCAAIKDAIRASPSADSQAQAVLSELLTNSIERIHKCMEEEQDLDVLLAQTHGITACLKAAEGGVLSAEQVRYVCERVKTQLQESTQRKAGRAASATEEELEEEEEDQLKDEQDQEQTLRASLAEILGQVMKYYPDHFALCAQEMLQPFFENFLHPRSVPDDRALAVYIADDIIEHLQSTGVPLWNLFMTKLIDCITDQHAAVRQAAAYGVNVASRVPAFSAMTDVAAARLYQCISMANANKKDKEATAAADNAIAALGQLCMHQGPALGARLGQCWTEYMNQLPLKQDEEEGQRVHAELMRLAKDGNLYVLGQGNANVGRLVAIFVGIYKTYFSTPELNTEIQQLIVNLGQARLEEFAQTLSKKQKEKLHKVWQDAQTKAARPAAK